MKLYVPLELQWTSRNLSYYHREFNSVRAVRGNARLLSRHCRAIGPHLALKGGISRFLELQWEVWVLLQLCRGPQGTFHGAFRSVMPPFTLWGHVGIPFQSLLGNMGSSQIEAEHSVVLSSCDRDLGVLIKFQQESQASSPFEAWNSALLSSCKKCVRPPVEFRWGPWTFSRGATVESNLPSCCEGLLGLPFESVQVNQALYRGEGELSVLSI